MNKINPEKLLVDLIKFNLDEECKEEIILTEIEAYELSLELWSFLAEDPENEKCDWDKFSMLDKVEDRCFLCHFHHSCAVCCLDCNVPGA